MITHAESSVALDNEATPRARELYLILFPTGFEERVEAILDETGVPGYSEGPHLLGRGARGRHFDNQVWPGTTGEIFTAIEARQSAALMQRLRAFDEELQRDSLGLHALHVLSWPCQRRL